MKRLVYPTVRLTAVAALALLFASVSARADFSYSGTTTGSPTYNRALAGNPPTGLSAVGTAVRYSGFSFSVNVSASYTFLSNSTGVFDNFTFLYLSTFNPAAPLSNALIGNDDNPSIGLSGFTYALTAGTNYVFVTTGFANTDFGAFTNTISGPGVITPAGTVPEPSSLALIVMALPGVLALRRSRRRSSTGSSAESLRLLA